MKERIFRSIVVISFMTCLVSAVMFSSVYYYNEEKNLRVELQEKFDYIKNGYETNGQSYLNSLKNSSDRITLIDKDGTVIFDNKAIVNQMVNHANRQEFMEAYKNGVGEGYRTSATLSYRTYYYAELLNDGKVLRLSENLESIFHMFVMIVPKIIAIMICIVLVILVFSRFVTMKIVAPLNKLSLLSTEAEMPYKEIYPFLQKIKDQSKLINSQITTLQRHETEFRIIFENMTEGLMLIDGNGVIKVKSLVCDRFLRLVGLVDSNGNLVFDEDIPVIHCIKQTLKKGINTSLIVEKNEKFLNFLINPIILTGAETEGAIVVIIDVTESVSREQLRREFSANVSHELKTPLTSISGFAEIIRNGIAKPEDIKHFADNIHNEAQRLLTLIADIIHLSTLDENSTVKLETENLDIYALTLNIMYYLKNATEQKYIKVKYDKNCGPTIINCVTRIVEECFYNLCDNAIKYNRLGGTISFNIYNKDVDTVVWQISDTGIGIPYQDQDRVFERFFRVDKSHSKSIGGTGLGLSIVKHGLAKLGGTIDLTSVEGQGSTFTITLPKKMPVVQLNT
jgi:two-component system, OmpR family, phosphate regulon sensor histidine kinase PhoR